MGARSTSVEQPSSAQDELMKNKHHLPSEALRKRSGRSSAIRLSQVGPSETDRLAGWPLGNQPTLNVHGNLLIKTEYVF